MVEDGPGADPIRSREDLPNTDRTRIDELLERGAEGRSVVWREIMQTYAASFTDYVRHRYRLEHDAAEVVHEFFVHQMHKDDYLLEWRASRRRLRDWLLKGIDFELMSMRTRKRREPVLEPLEPDARAEDSDAHERFFRSNAAALFEEAYRRAAADCRARGLGDHWRVLEEHVTNDRSYAEFAAALGITEAAAADMKRTAAARLKRAVEDVLIEDGVPRSNVAESVREFIRLLGGDGRKLWSP